MRQVWQDVRFAVRGMRRAPVFTLAASATLALGIGSSAALYSFVDAFLLRPLPFEQPEELVHVWSTDRARGDLRLRSSLPEFRAWREQANSFADLALFNYTEANLSGFAEPERLPIGLVSANAFELLGRGAILGRGFARGEDAPGAPAVVVLSHAFWQRRFAGESSALGQTLELDGTPHEIVGVMPPDFAFPLNTTRLWKPYALDEARYDRERRSFQVVARLRDGVSRPAAQAELEGVAQRLEAAFPDHNADRGVNLVPLRNALNFASEVLDPMAALLGVAVGLVLAITCANVASLLLSRASSRERELAIRSALGAGRGRVVRQLLTESALLSLGGAILGLPLALGALAVMDAAVPPDIYRVGRIGLDQQGVLVALAVSLLAALAFGSLPALRATRRDLVLDLKEGGRSGAGARGTRVHAALSVVQVSMAFALLICAALVTRSLGSMNDVPLGFDGDVLTGHVYLTTARYEDEENQRAFQRGVLEALAAEPSVGAASIVNFLPLNHETSMRGYQPAEHPPAADAPPPRAIDVVVAPGYFETMGIPLVQGRDFDDRDAAGAPAVVVVNQALASATWPGESPIGRSLRLTRGTEEVVARVVGIAANARHMRLADPPERMLYVPLYQEPWRYMRVLVRSGEGRDAGEVLRRAVASVDPTLPVTELRPMSRVARDFLIPQRMVAGALGLLGVAALLLAVVGIYGVLAQNVASRTREIGVRMALGATRAGILAMVIRRGLALTGTGAALGVGGALATARLLESFLFGIRATDPTIVAGATLALAATAALACLVPSLRASRIDPLEALRAE